VARFSGAIIFSCSSGPEDTGQMRFVIRYRTPHALLFFTRRFLTLQ
jgi:hypothetical protein